MIFIRIPLNERQIREFLEARQRVVRKSAKKRKPRKPRYYYPDFY